MKVAGSTPYTGGKGEAVFCGCVRKNSLRLNVGSDNGLSETEMVEPVF